ncbi:MAG: ASKHA domain-containing protein [Candidatus Hermodarchaeota archaeon]
MVKSPRYGVSVDLGTSQITMHLVDLNAGLIADSKLVPNPQIEFGLDVISRIGFRRKSETNAQLVTDVARTAVSTGILEMISQTNVDPNSVRLVVLVGNTVMHHLFYGLSTKSLLAPPFRATGKDAISVPALEVGLQLGEGALCYSPPIVESFIGPDALMLLIVSGALDSEQNLVAIDVGTNTEIAVRSPRGLWMASAASGPAFEGMSLTCGVPGENGAIAGVELGETHEPRIAVIGGGNPKGICGSGAISALASLRNTDLMNAKGSIRRDVSFEWLKIVPGGPQLLLANAFRSETKKPIFLSQSDVRMLQQSKAAIAGAMRLLLRKAKCSASEVSQFFLTGAFGTALNLEDAFQIGLFPRFENAHFQQFEGGAIAGADMILKDSRLRSKIEAAPERISYIELTDNPEFQEYYLKSQHFIPISD